MEKKGSSRLELEIRRYDRDRNLLLQAGHDRKYIFEELTRLYPEHPEFLLNDEIFNLDTEPSEGRKSNERGSETRKKSRPRCIETGNPICMPGLIARYNSMRNYDVLDDNFEEVYHLILDSLTTSKTPDGSPPSSFSDPFPIEPDPFYFIEPEPLLTLGIFQIQVYNNEISFVKVEWDDDVFDGLNLDINTFEELMKISIFQEYMELYITKIVQDRCVYKKSERNPDRFYVFLDFYFNRPLTQSDQFHQDHVNFIYIDYFTLTYIIPEDKVILGASVLIQSDTPIGMRGRLEKGKYAALSVAVKNLTTLGITNTDKLFHSTPAPVSCRSFITEDIPCVSFIPSSIREPRIGSLEEFNINPDTFEYEDNDLPGIDIELVPLEMEPLPHYEMGPVRKVIDDTATTRRTFLRCGYANIKGSPVKISNVYMVRFNMELYEEINSIENITLDTFFEHVVGGKRKTRAPKKTMTKKRKPKSMQLIQLRKILYNPNKNIILKQNLTI